MRRNLVVRHKTEKVKLSLIQINKLKKLIKHNQNNDYNNLEEKNNNSDSNSILSISSIDEKMEINEDIEIKKEIDILNKLLGNNETNNLFILIWELKKYLRKRNKTNDIKKEIETKQNEIKKVVQHFFEILLNKLSIEEIIDGKQHLEIFEELKKIKKFGVYSSKDIDSLEKKILEERNKEVQEYKTGYSNITNDEKTEKKWRRSSSIEQVFSRKNKAHKTLKENNFQFEFNKGKRKKINLIYNNSYLLKDDNSDDENKSNSLIKKEIQEILNTDYGQKTIKIPTSCSPLVSRRRKFEKYSKKKFVKRASNRFLLKLDDELLDKEILLKFRKKDEELEKELIKEKMRDQKIYEFFAKIQRLKKGKTNIDNDELDLFIDQQIDQNNEIPKEKNGGRLNIFLQEFQSSRIRAKYDFNLKNKKIGCLSPIIFTYPNKTNIIDKNLKDTNKKK